MPPALLTLCAHVEGYRAILAAWKGNNFSQHMSVVDFPAGDLLSYAGRHYNRLKQEQAGTDRPVGTEVNRPTSTTLDRRNRLTEARPSRHTTKLQRFDLRCGYRFLVV